jgi:spermidine/putrescine transport system substrate-binding protein
MKYTRRIPRTGNHEAILVMLAANQIDRREFLRRVGAGGVLMLGGPALLAACGGGGGGAGNGLSVDNWIEYIDVDDAGNSPTIARFEEQTGIDVTYTEGVNSNEEWFGKYQPQLAAGQALGIDVVVLTDYMAARMIRLGYVETIDHANVPNMTNLASALRSPGFDPNRDYTLPWQSGFDVLGYDIEQTGRELTSWSDLLDPAFSGKVGLLEAYIDSIPPFLFLEGKSPADASVEDFVAATAAIKEIVDSGQVRQIYGNDYLDALLNGDLAVSIAYSGDIVANQADNPQLRYVLPQEGYALWTDNMMIPKAAANKAGAEAWMNYYYEPVNAAELAAYIWYVSPVVGAREAVAEIDESLVNEPLIFPDEAILSNAHIVRAFTEEEEALVNDALASATGV